MVRILIKLPRSVVDEESGKTVRLGKFEKYYVRDENNDFSDTKRTFKAGELKTAPCRLVKEKDEYIVLEADFLDEYKQLKRLAQIITLKDLGRIITMLGLNKDSMVVEAGSGSGAATKYFASVVKEVHSYEQNKEHLEVAKENCAGFDNVRFYEQDIYEAVGDHCADGFLLDVPEPWRALGSVVTALRVGGRCVVYSPNLTQTQQVVLGLPGELLYEGTVQLTEQDWVVREGVLRPRMQGLGHTAFLTLIRKVPS